MRLRVILAWCATSVAAVAGTTAATLPFASVVDAQAAPPLAADASLFRPADPAVTREVERELVAAIDAYNRGDLDGYLRVYADAPDLVCVYRGQAFHGLAQLRADLAARFFANIPASGRPESEQVVVRLMRLDRLGDRDVLATVVVRARVDSAESAAGVSSLVLRRVGGRWRVVYEHTS